MSQFAQCCPLAPPFRPLPAAVRTAGGVTLGPLRPKPARPILSHQWFSGEAARSSHCSHGHDRPPGLDHPGARRMTQVLSGTQRNPIASSKRCERVTWRLRTTLARPCAHRALPLGRPQSILCFPLLGRNRLPKIAGVSHLSSAPMGPASLEERRSLFPNVLI